MKRVLILFSLIFSLTITAQVLTRLSDDSCRIEPLLDRLSKLSEIIPQEAVFVHMDNTAYFLGDTIFYNAYVVRADRRTPTDISGVLYVELLNHDGYLVERQIVRLEDGRGAGAFALPDTLYAGFYELRAYTRWQLNWGTTEHRHSNCSEDWFLTKEYAQEFFRDYDKLYSRVFPVYDKPLVAGEYRQDMTLRPLRRYVRTNEGKDKPVVSIYPEGGTWIAGTRQRLAFEALDGDGRHLDGRLVLKDSHGDVVAQAVTEHRGRGVLDIRTQEGETYSAAFHHGSSVDRVCLPEQNMQGLSMRVEQVTNGVNISCSGNLPIPSTLSLTVLSNGILQDVFEITDSLIFVPTEEYPSGVLQFTLHDASGRIWADRLSFVWNDDIRPGNLKVSGLPATCSPYEPVTIQLKTIPGAVVSVAVRDASNSPKTYDSGTLASELLLCSQIKGFVESPDYYFENDDSIHRRHLDLLLMVQGWRRYRWQELTDTSVPTHPAEKSPTYEGEVTDYTPLDAEDAFYVGNSTESKSVGLNGKQEENADRQSGMTENGNHASYAGCGPQIEEMMRFTAPHPFLDEMVLEYGQRLKFTHTEQFDSLRERMQTSFWLFSSTLFDMREHQRIAPLKKEVQVHAEFVQPQQSGLAAVTGDQQTRSTFRIQSPHISAPYYLYLTAGTPGKDSTAWIVADATERPQYNVRMKNFFPRFVKPYTYYQTCLPIRNNTEMGELRRKHTDATEELPELDVISNWHGLRAVNLAKPAYVLDAYDAFNQTVDAGFTTSWYAGSLTFSQNVARLVCGDMGVSRPYVVERRWDGRNLSTNLTWDTQWEYNHLNRLNRVAVYTDYAPRMEGDPRYMASSQPNVVLNMELLPDGTRRAVYRDRRYIMPGYNVCADFYQPHYEQIPPSSHADHRRTLYWNPQVRLDSTGCAAITFYGNSYTSKPIVSAEGITSGGTILWLEMDTTGAPTAAQTSDAENTTTLADTTQHNVTRTSRIVDAVSGEPLAYAKISTSSRMATLSNLEGDFTLSTSATDELRISYMGYNPLCLPASSLPPVVALQPMTHEIDEVTVQGLSGGIDRILEKVRRQLMSNRFSRNAKRSQYFFRLTNIEESRKEVAEAFIEASSNINLRQLEVFSGKHFSVGEAPSDSLSQLLNSSNLHYILNLAPMVQDVPAWSNLHTPMSLWKNMRSLLREGRYAVSSGRLHDSEGHTLYSIEFALTEKFQHERGLSGTLYVDSASLRLLSFDGKLHGYALRLSYGNDEESRMTPLRMQFHVDYVYERGYAEVETIRCPIDYGHAVVRMMMFKLQDGRLPVRRRTSVQDNLFTAIKKAGIDDSFWTEGIVLRTEEEERIAQDGVEKIEK